MKVEVGYITSWRRAIFCVFVGCIVIFGLAATLSASLLGAGLVSNIISVGALTLCIGLFILVLADKWNRYSGTGTATIEDGKLCYNDRKRHFNIALKDITKLDMEPVTIGREGGKPIAFSLLIQLGRKKYYIESDRACGRSFDEVDLHRLYLYIREHMS